MKRVFIDSNEFQSIILNCITSNEIDDIFNTTAFSSSVESKACKQAMIHGMVIASMMTCRCEQYESK